MKLDRHSSILIAAMLLSIGLLTLPGLAGSSSKSNEGEPLADWLWFEQPDPERAVRYNASHPRLPFTYQYVRGPAFEILEADKVVLVLVNTSLRPSIQDELDQYEADINATGYDLALVETEGGTQDDVKSLILTGYTTWGTALNGCLLVGELPIPWFQHFDDWYGNEDTFACDLFYGDMDGTWTDTDSNGVPDSHTDGSGDTKPEIWVGRVTAHDMSEDEVTLVKRFFANNHQYRLGNTMLPRRALLYQDDDWNTSPGWYNSFGNLLSDRDWISDTETTNATDYKTRFDDNYQWLLVCSHSNASVNSFRTSSGNTYFYCSELRNMDPQFNFCITFACSNADYSVADYMSGWYLLAGEYTQLVLGSTKTGGFWYGYKMFESLENRNNLGEAYNEWFSNEYPYSDGDISWWYGLTLLGDPTLYVPSDTYIDLASFDAEPDDDSILVTWETGLETDNAAFVLFREVAGTGEYKQVSGLIASEGSASCGASYSFTDYNAERGITYSYWLVDIDTSGNWAAHGPASARLPMRLELLSDRLKARPTPPAANWTGNRPATVRLLTRLGLPSDSLEETVS